MRIKCVMTKLLTAGVATVLLLIVGALCMLSMGVAMVVGATTLGLVLIDIAGTGTSGGDPDLRSEVVTAAGLNLDQSVDADLEQRPA